MLDRNTVRHDVLTSGSASVPPPGEFSVTASIALHDRIAAAIHSYSDLFAAARRRLLYLLFGTVLVLSMLVGFSAWHESGRQSVAAFAARFASDLFGLGGLPILIIAVPLLVYYVRYPAVVRKRLRRWYQDEGLDQPLEATFRFEPGGLAVTTAGSRSVLGCSRIQGVTETRDHFFIQIRNIEDGYVLPLRALSPEQIAQIKAWADNCQVSTESPMPALFDQSASADEQALLVSRFQMTEADRAVAIYWQMDRPGMRRRRRRGFLLAFLVTALTVPLVLVLLWLIDPARVPVRYAFPLLVEIITGSFWKYILAFWTFLAAMMLLHPWTRRRHAHKLARQLHKRVRADEHEVRLYPSRLEVLQDGWRNEFEVGSFERIERQNQHLILLRRVGEPLILPMRALEGNQLALFERVINGGGATQDPSSQGQA